MTGFFPRKTVNWHLEEPHAARWLSIWLVPMAVASGVLLRLVRAVLLGSLAPSWAAIGAYYAITGAIFFTAMTVHLGNYTVRQWLWRVPAFAAVESAAEAAVSLLLIAVWREPMGSTYAHYHDWWPLALSGLWYRELAAIVYAGLLAAVVQFVRYVMLPRDEREQMDAEGDRETAEVRRESVEQALLP